MAAIQNARDTLLQAAGTRLGNVTLPSNVAVDFAYVTGTTKPSNNADVTTSILTNSGTSIVMNNANLFKSNSGAGGVFIGSGGLFGKDSGGNETFAIDASTGATRYKGDISGGSNINITGSARFRGTYTGSYGAAAIYANEAYGALNGIIGVTNGGGGAGVTGYSNGTGISSGYGVLGTDNGSAAGVAGYSAAGVGVDGQSGTGIGVLGNGTTYGVYSQGHAYVQGNLTVTGTISGTVGTATYAGTSGEVNNPGNAAVRAVSGAYSLIVQTDRNVVLYDGASSIWSTGTAVSDFRLKTAIQSTALHGLDAICALRVVDFQWKPESPFDDDGVTHTGFIAQEVAEVVGDATKQVGDTMHLHKEEIVPLLVKAVQELLARVEALEATP